MIEEGLIALIGADTTIASLCTAGGWAYTLPKGACVPSWSYLFVSDVPDYNLGGRNPYTMRRLQLDVFGATSSDCRKLAAAIDKVLSGYHGTLTDTDATVVQACFRSDITDFFDDLARTYRRMLEYEVHFAS